MKRVDLRISNFFNAPLRIFSPQERWGVASRPSTPQQGGDDERCRKAFSPPPWCGVEGFLSHAAEQSGVRGERRGGETQSDHRSQSWPLPLRTWRSEVIIPSDLWPLVSFVIVLLRGCKILSLFLSKESKLSVGRCKRYQSLKKDGYPIGLGNLSILY